MLSILKTPALLPSKSYLCPSQGFVSISVRTGLSAETDQPGHWYSANLSLHQWRVMGVNRAYFSTHASHSLLLRSSAPLCSSNLLPALLPVPPISSQPYSLFPQPPPSLTMFLQPPPSLTPCSSNLIPALLSFPPNSFFFRSSQFLAAILHLSLLLQAPACCML